MLDKDLHISWQENMEPSTLGSMIEVDELHPWYKARMVLINEVIGTNISLDAKVLDFGCGSGAVLEMLKNKGLVNIRGADVSESCVTLAKSRGLEVNLIKPGYSELVKRKYDLILLLDVLEHIENDLEVLSILRSSLSDNGRILITVPAHNFLWRSHDDANHHYRRYSRKSLVKLIADSDCTIIHLRWWNSIMFLGFLFISIRDKLSKRFFKDTSKKEDNFDLPSKFISKVILRILSIESKSELLGKCMGVSLIALIKK